MSAEPYPSIGYDPARGNVATLENLASELKSTSDYAREAREALNSIKANQDIWTGGASQKFAENIEDLPGYLDDADWAMNHAGKALKAWSDRLTDLKQHASRIEENLREALDKEQQALAAAQHANQAQVQAASQFSDAPADQGAAEAATRANKAAASAAATVEELRRNAEQLKNSWEDASRECAKKLREAGDRAPDEGFWEGIGEFFEGALSTIGDIAGIVSAIAGVLSFIPGINAIAAPVALVSGAIALGAHAADMAVKGNFDDPNAWISLAGDAIGLVPGVKAAKAGLDTVGEAASLSGKMAKFSTGAASEMYEASEIVTKITSKIPGLTDEAATTTAKVFESSATTLVQAPAVDKVASGEDKAVHDVAGGANLILAGITAK
ncbi:hypothetical protein GCM10009676_22910 [Prauserella halophila]|uniref:WXG100 family type VII secretion target n=1 Tax=Prauserella halophila TaxID=185641 RepID=A0ABN1W9E6_9PSEU|nr:HrpF/NolX family T3SS translocon protein [Prauserella halophila]MCP2235519.1 hypothetical protein [Prauserella halophila]